MIRLIFLLALSTFATTDLVAPFTVDLISSRHPLWDTIQITTYLSDRGDLPTTQWNFSAVALDVGLDSFNVVKHSFPPNYVLNAGFFTTFTDTTVAPKGKFSVWTHCDPLFDLGQGGAEANNDVRSQAYNFHPQVQTILDTILLIDTLKITIHDTVNIAIHDTVKVVVHDTLKLPTLAKAASVNERPIVATTVYNAIGTPEWVGMLREGEFPQTRLKQGLHLMLQGRTVRRFRVAYK